MQAPLSPQVKLAEKQARRKAVISLTPLVDVVFILLIFFMLASSFMEWRSLSLDTAAASQSSAPSEQTPFIVAVDSDKLLLNGEAISLNALIEKAQIRQPSDQAISVQPLGETQVQQLITLLDALKAADIQPLKLVDDPQWPVKPGRQAREARHALP